MNTRRLLACCLLAAAPLAAWAADEPDAVYAKFHAAVLAADFGEMRKHGTAKKGEEIASLPAVAREAALGLMARMLPKYYKVDRRTIEADGSRATLHLSAGRAYGTVLLLKEGGDWKVDEARWAE
jgi:hypothetical protein